jgi:hypothetical protein
MRAAKPEAMLNGDTTEGFEPRRIAAENLDDRQIRGT